MTSQFDQRKSGNRVRMCRDFVDGLECFRVEYYERALIFFSAADKCAAVNDIYQGRYTSFHGLSRVCMGDRDGVKLCRKAAVAETLDAEVYYNLAMAEHRLGSREGTCIALRRGLRIDPQHAGMLCLKQQLAAGEKRGLVSGLKCNNVFYRLFGNLFRGMRRPHPDHE
jgi:hypothetical protein